MGKKGGVPCNTTTSPAARLRVQAILKGNLLQRYDDLTFIWDVERGRVVLDVNQRLLVVLADFRAV